MDGVLRPVPQVKFHSGLMSDLYQNLATPVEIVSSGVLTPGGIRTEICDQTWHLVQLCNVLYGPINIIFPQFWCRWAF
jgi:hypothetical protein